MLNLRSISNNNIELTQRHIGSSRSLGFRGGKTWTTQDRYHEAHVLRPDRTDASGSFPCFGLPARVSPLYQAHRHFELSYDGIRCERSEMRSIGYVWTLEDMRR
ncbi:hypothetical protein PG985_003039 [Apiospora marii]|uniref:Uncharacterized protein n=1 Tax=Apiospora marii TaxID=335849 RepID=A0ABR1RUF6_9PEZI